MPKDFEVLFSGIKMCLDQLRLDLVEGYFCIKEGNISINNIDNSEREFIYVNVGESGIVGSSVFSNTVVGPERPAIY